MSNRIWDDFLAEHPWYDSRKIKFGRRRRPSTWPSATPALTERFPVLTRLLSAASSLPLELDGRKFVLFTWPATAGGLLGWLSPATIPLGDVPILPDHLALLRSFGGITERMGERLCRSWLLNHNDALTLREAVHDATFLADYQWAWSRRGLSIPIVLDDYYSIAREANGNTTLCHRTTGRVLLFAPDHAFTHITVLPGCPPYSLYTIDGAPTFRDWVEAIAGQFTAATGMARP